MTVRSLNYLKRLDKEIKTIAEENGLKEDEVYEIVDEFFKTKKKFITDPRMPRIQITNWGTFKPSIGKIYWQIKTAIYYYKTGAISREKLNDKIRKLWPVRNRLIKEKNKQSTWNSWKNKKL